MPSKESREEIKQIIESHNEYLDLTRLEEMLLKKQYDKIKAINVIDRERLIKDVQSGKLMKKFMDNYLQTKMDVVSLAEARETIANA